MNKKNYIATACLVSVIYCGMAAAKVEDDLLYYTIGGGSPINGSANSTTKLTLLEPSIKWNTDLSCGGSFDPKITVSNQLNGITKGFKNMMGDMLKNAKGAVASLPGAVLQRTNPDIFEMLQNGVLQGKIDYENALTSCESMQEVMVGTDSPAESLGMLAKNVSWKEKKADSDGDILTAQEDVEEEHGNGGVPWYDGNNRGGYGQAPINSVYDAAFVGYNLLMNRNVTYKSSISSTIGRGKPVWEYWKSPDNAAAWITNVVGETSWRTCKGCKQSEGKPGKGLTYFYDTELNKVETVLLKLVNKEIPINKDNMASISAPPSLVIHDKVIEALRYETQGSKPLLISRIAGEIALTRTFEKGVLAKRLLVTGKKEPNIINVQQAQKSIQESIDRINDELRTIVEEVDLRKKITGNTLTLILSRYDERNRDVGSKDTSAVNSSSLIETTLGVK